MKRKIKFRLPELIGQNENITRLSKRLGLSRQTVYGLLSGRSVGIEWKTLEKICNGLELSPADLIVMESTDRKG